MRYITDDGEIFNTSEEAALHEIALNAPARTIVFSGHSDDIVEVTGYDSKNPNDVEEFYTNRFMLKNSAGEGMKITAVYDGCWSFAVGLLDEDKPLPKWLTVHKASGYSCELHVDVPAGTGFFKL